MYKYFIAAIVVDGNDKINFQVIRVSHKFKLEFSLMTESEILDLVKQGAVVIGLNKKSSHGNSLNYEKYSGRLKSALLKMNPLISKQIPIIESSKDNYKTAIHLKQLNGHLYEAVTVDMYCNAKKVIIDTNKRGYTTLAWNVRYPINGEKTLEIVGLKTAENRGEQIRKQMREQLKRTAEVQQEEIRRKNLAEQLMNNARREENKSKKLARFWVVGLNCEIIKPSKDMGDKEYTGKMWETTLIKWSEKDLRVVDMNQKVGDKFKILNMSYLDVYDLSLYENVGNMQRLELKWCTYNDNEEEPWMEFGIGETFSERTSVLYSAAKADIGCTLNETYERLVDTKKKKIDAMHVCIDIKEVEGGIHELVLLDCNGGMRKIKVNTGSSINKNILDAAKVFNITNICKLKIKSTNETIRILRKSFEGVGNEINQLGGLAESCGVCNKIDDYVVEDGDVNKKSSVATVSFYDKLYDVEIINLCSQNMTKEEINNNVRFKILKCRENTVLKSLGIKSNKSMEQVYIGLDYGDCDMDGFILDKA